MSIQDKVKPGQRGLLRPEFIIKKWDKRDGQKIQKIPIDNNFHLSVYICSRRIVSEKIYQLLVVVKILQKINRIANKGTRTEMEIGDNKNRFFLFHLCGGISYIFFPKIRFTS